MPAPKVAMLRVENSVRLSGSQDALMIGSLSYRDHTVGVGESLFGSAFLALLISMSISRAWRRQGM